MKLAAGAGLLAFHLLWPGGAVAQGAPLVEIAGRWTNDLQITGQSSFTKSENSAWVGKFWGVIEPTGKVAFRAENGCFFEGLLAPHYSSFQGAVFATKCSNPSFNRGYDVRVQKTGQLLSMTGTASTIGPGRVEATYTLKGTLSRF